MASQALTDRVQAAHRAARAMAQASDAQRRDALARFAQALEDRREEISQANRGDVEAAREAVETGEMSQALLDRLVFQDAKIDQAARGVRAVADQEDPVGETVRATRLDEGLKLFQVRVPLGVVACAYESRPDAGVQMAALAMRSGNALVLKGGSEARASNRLLAEIARDALGQAGLPEDAIVALEDRTELHALLELDHLVDLVIPRGSSGFVRFVQENTRIPVLGHADGVCHTYVDEGADLDQALEVCLDAKLDYPAACNATECFLIHQAEAGAFVPRLVQALGEHGVEVRADEVARKLAPQAEQATEEDWGHEWGDLVCALKVVDGLDEAISFINTHGSGHTDAILTRDPERARRFVAGLDTAGAFVNASTRFADGYRYGLGAEVGISTGKVHARGPVGLQGLTTTTWVLQGEGHLAATYQGEQARAFRHEDLEESYGG
ncbi:MAG: glutamate-5-semialdehyde dehydrogenase [Candidatus Thermoplasmatota archaeon]|nr:glutamate-5-semialdehyde dehydrogenase [Candidatus Thermoplasmatota archaeon]